MPIGLKYRTPSYAENVYDCYFYEKNLQGDIVAVYNEDGVKIGTYTYDAWGNVTATALSTNSLDSLILTSYNPFRYRGYYYDVETSLYYLQSRYYNAEWGRFVNADGVSTFAATPEGLTDKNLYAYCDNNPIVRYDNGGDFWHVLIGAGVGAIINMTITAAGQLMAGEQLDLEEIFISGAIGAASGALTSMGVPVSVLVPVNAGLSAGESIYSDIKNNKAGETNYSAVDIVVRATISAGVSALFTFAGGSSNGREISSMRKAAKASAKLLNSGGVNPVIKKGLNGAINSYHKVLKKHAADCLTSSIMETPFSAFSSYYAKEAYGISFGGIE